MQKQETNVFYLKVQQKKMISSSQQTFQSLCKDSWMNACLKWNFAQHTVSLVRCLNMDIPNINESMNEWEDKFCLNIVKGKCLCLFCHSTVSVNIKHDVDVEIHFKSNHKDSWYKVPSQLSYNEKKCVYPKCKLFDSTAYLYFTLLPVH
jgi:hypothetical protein